MRQEFENTNLWHNRGYLPHYDAELKYQMITYRLADSLPKETAQRLYKNSLEQNDLKRRIKIEQILDSGYGSCILKLPKIAGIVKENWLFFDKKKYDLIAYVIMPNHVHILIKTYLGNPLKEIIHSWKSYTGKMILRELNEDEAPKSGGKIWQDEYWDRFIRDQKHYLDAINYIHNNPVKAGLVNKPVDWIWTSAKSIAGEPPASPES